jgi:methyl-accepting chemotaxis protein
MKIFSTIRLKTKISFLVIPPTILFIVFAGLYINTLAETVSDLTWNKKLHEELLPYVHLSETLFNELNSSFAFIEGEQIDLNKQYNETDQAIAMYRERIASNKHVDLPQVNAYETRILMELAQLPEIRNKLSNKKIEKMQTFAFYMKIKRDCLEAIDAINNLHITHTGATKPNIAYISLLKEEFAFEELSLAIELLLLDKKTSSAALENLAALRERERDNYLEFKNYAPPEIFRLYAEKMSDPSVMRVDEMVDAILAGKVDITLHDWSKEVVQKDLLLNQALNKIDEHILNLTQKMQSNALSILVTTSCIALAILLLIIFLAYIISRDINRSINALDHEIKIITDSSSNVVTTIAKIVTGQSETESAVTETNASMEELRHTSELTSKNAQDTLASSNGARETLQASSAAMKTTIGDLNQIQEKMGVISDSTGKLNDHCQAIGQIIDSVSDLANQSHVLAVNASIEAAKAGEQGKGFAVVAQEVRNLAEQSKQATTKVHDILSDIQNAMNNTVLATEQGSTAVGKGVEQSAATDELMTQLITDMESMTKATEQICSATEQQFTAVDQTKEAISNIKTTSINQTEELHLIETNINGLNTVIEALLDVMKAFKSTKDSLT